MMTWIRKIARAEPVAIAGAVGAFMAVVAAFTNLITPEQSVAIVAIIVPFHALLRSFVFAPDTVQTIVESTVGAGVEGQAVGV